jgi:regulator of protease activity HflC (stomatin/prohibitin superfamily)
VPEASVTPIEFCGRNTGFAPAGCNFVGCCSGPGRNLSLQVRQTNVQIKTRTHDNVFVTVDVSIQWSVIQDALELKHMAEKPGGKDLKDLADVSDFAASEHDMSHGYHDLNRLSKDDFFWRATYASHLPDNQVVVHSEEFFRITVAKYKMDKLFDLGTTITAECARVLNRAINEYGFKVIKVVIRDILPEDRVRRAMNDIVASQKERDAQVTRADADKTARIKAAEADAQVSKLHGEGIAMQRQAIVAGLRKSVEDFAAATHADAESVMALMMLTQHTDMLKEAVKEAKGVNLILSTNPHSGNGDMESQVEASLGQMATSSLPPSTPSKKYD